MSVKYSPTIFCSDSMAFKAEKLQRIKCIDKNVGNIKYLNLAPNSDRSIHVCLSSSSCRIDT